MQEEFDKLYEAVLTRAKVIYYAKKIEYDAVIDVDEKMIYGMKSYVHELWQGVERLRSLEKRSKDEKSICKYFDVLLDTLFDIINYSTYLAIHIMKRCGKITFEEENDEISTNPSG